MNRIVQDLAVRSARARSDYELADEQTQGVVQLQQLQNQQHFGSGHELTEEQTQRMLQMQQLQNQQHSGSDYELTDEQTQGMLQLQQLQNQQDGRLEDDEWDPNGGIFGEMDYSTFVTQRLKEVNEQWDKEPLPEDDSRHKMIEFKKDQELTSVFVPSPYPGEEGEELLGENPGEEGEELLGEMPNGAKADDAVDNFTIDDSCKTEDNSKTLENKENVPSPKRMDHHEPHQADNESTGNIDPAVLPGETLVNNNTGQKNKPKRKRKSIRFSGGGCGEDERGDDNNSLQSSNSDDMEEAKNKNNNSAFEQDDNDNTHETQSKSLSHDQQRSEDSSSPTNHSSSSNTNSNNGTAGTGSNEKEEKVLVEINGKFELVSVKDYQSMTMWKTEESNGTDPYSHHQRLSRPKSSVGSRSNASAGSDDKRRAQSATGSRSSSQWQDWDSSNYVSPYALTPEQKDLKERRERIIKEREKTQKERKIEEDKRKQEEAESMFKWWLLKKDEEQKQKHSVNKQDKPEDREARKHENEEAFNAWCEAKKEQQKKDRLLKNREQKERDDGYFTRSRDECEQAFKRWLKNKKKEQNIMYAMSASRVKPKCKKYKSKSTRPGSSRTGAIDLHSKSR